MHPDWLGSPQHVLGGLALASAIAIGARRVGLGSATALALALGGTMLAESLIELIEYPLLYGGSADGGSYYDTIADMASTLAGAVIAVAILALRWRTA